MSRALLHLVVGSPSCDPRPLWRRQVQAGHRVTVVLVAGSEMTDLPDGVEMRRIDATAPGEKAGDLLDLVWAHDAAAVWGAGSGSPDERRD